MSRLKLILKRIFPIVFLKRAFLFYNQVKIATWDKILFPELLLDRSHFTMTEEKNPFIESGLETSGFPEAIRKKLEIWTDPEWKQDQYLLRLQRPILVDPVTGWAMTPKRRLIYASLGFSRAPHVKRPSILGFLNHRGKAVVIEKVISLRDTGEQNYFHFFNDVLAKLFFLQEQKIDVKSYTLVVSDKLFSKHYFQFFLKHSWLADLSWYIQTDQWVRAEEIIFCKPYTHTKRYFEKAVAFTGVAPSSLGDRKIFLVRNRESLRYIENEEEIAAILAEKGFLRVEASSLSFVEQVNLFAECRYLVAIHGAGLTNIIFRQSRPMHVLEILQPFPYVPFHYILLSHQFGYRHDIVLGKPGIDASKGGFRVEPAELAAKIDSMFSSSIT